MAQKKDQKTGKWYYYGSYLQKDGKRVQYKKRGFSTERKARIAEEEFREEIENTKEKILFNDLIDKYEEYTDGRIKESSHNKHHSILKKWRNRFGDVYVQDLKEDELQSFVDELDKNYSKRYVEKIYYDASAVFNFGVKKKLIQFNPLVDVEKNERPNEAKKEMLFWEPDDFDKFIVNVDDIMWKTLFSTLYLMGCRKGECIALTWKDIDFKDKTMNINKTSGAKERNKKVKYTTPKTNNSYRIITIPNSLVRLLKEWKEVESTFSGFSEDSFVFGNDLPMPAETIRRNFDKYTKLTNLKLRKEEHIPRIRVHDLRHSHASYLINNMSNGFTDYDIAKRLGDTLETLHNTYAHWFKTKDSKIIHFMNTDINFDKKIENTIRT